MDILLQGINHSIESFVNDIVKNFSLSSSDKKKILSLWNKKDKSNESNEVEILTSEQILKCNVSGLKSLCKKYKLKRSGKKEELIKRLISHMNSEDNGKKPKAINKIKKTKKEDDIGIIQIKRNQFGNFEHFETGLVFSKLDKKVIGKQNEDGTITELTKNDIEICNKFKFKYTIPENLNNKDVEDSESDEEGDSDVDDEIIEEIEEENTEEDYFSD